MSQYSLFTHGNALRIETPGALADYIHVGWGAQVTFKEPVPQDFLDDVAWPIVGPGSWFHLPLPMTLTTFGRRNPYLKSVTILFDTSHCRITNVHVWDGAVLVHEFNGLRLKGEFLWSRDTNDVNGEAHTWGSPTFSNTLTLTTPHKVFSAIGVSFYACAYFEDFNVHGFVYHQPFIGPFPPAVLTVSAAGGQFLVEDPADHVTISVTALEKVGIRVGP
jgi:hypothetical protein